MSERMKLKITCLDCKKSKESFYCKYPEDNEDMLCNMVDWIRKKHNGHRITVEETNPTKPRSITELLKGRK